MSGVALPPTPQSLKQRRALPGAEGVTVQPQLTVGYVQPLNGDLGPLNAEALAELSRFVAEFMSTIAARSHPGRQDGPSIRVAHRVQVPSAGARRPYSRASSGPQHRQQGRQRERAQDLW